MRIGTCTAQDAIRAINAAADGPVAQGQRGGRCMMSFGFAGSIGTSSRISIAEGTFTVGVRSLQLWQDAQPDGGGSVVEQAGRDSSRGEPPGTLRGSIIVVAADIPLLSSRQFGSPSGRPWGLAAPVPAASTSGEIIVAFRHGQPNATALEGNPDKFIQLRCISDAHINEVYEAVIEAHRGVRVECIFSNGNVGTQGALGPGHSSGRSVAQLASPRGSSMKGVPEVQRQPAQPILEVPAGPLLLPGQGHPLRVDVIKKRLRGDPALPSKPSGSRNN